MGRVVARFIGLRGLYESPINGATTIYEGKRVRVRGIYSELMKRYLLLLIIIIPFLTNCGGGGGGGGGTGDPSSGDNSTGSKTNPLCSAVSSVAKTKVNEDGLYKIAYLDLYNACIDLSRIDPSTLKMTNQGEEVSIDVIDKDGNGLFDDGDYIEFYGRGIQRGDDRFRFTETNVYWLSEDSGYRKRFEKIASNNTALPTPVLFRKTIHVEEDTYYEQKNLPEVASSNDVREHWFWGEVFYTPGVAGNAREYYQRDYNFSTPHIDKNNPVSLKLRLQSVSGSHHIRAYINGNPILNEVWGSPYGQDSYELRVDNIPASFFNNGPNVLRLESVGDTLSGIFELFYLDWFEVIYYHLYMAEHDVLEFTGDGQIELSNFTSSDISVYEISNPAAVKKVTSVKVEGPTTSGYKAIFSGQQNGGFLALTSTRKKTPLSVEAYFTANIRSRDANYIIVTHEDLYDAVNPLADYRGGMGYKVLTVKVKDIYDEFGDGIESPLAIKDFLKYAYYNWSTRPEYVLLVGDATVDYKDISGYGRGYGVKSYVPAYLYNYQGLGEVPSDNWFVDVDSANGILPEMNIGRIPAKSPADVSAVINKIISHERSINKSDNVLLIADYDFSSGTLFETMSNSIAGIIPSDYTVSKLYQQGYSGDFRTGIISAINSGPLIVNYTGHGSVIDWTKEDAFSSEDVVYLTNRDRYPFVVALNCLNGYFVLPNDDVVDGSFKQYPSIAEAFLLASEKGSVAVLAASAIGYPSEHDPLAQALSSIVFKDGETVLGDAVTMAKENAYRALDISEDVVKTFILFGDPATRLK